MSEWCRTRNSHDEEGFMTRRGAWALLAIAIAGVVGGVVTEVRADNPCTGSVIYHQLPDGSWSHGSICVGSCPHETCTEVPGSGGRMMCGCVNTLQPCCHLEWSWDPMPVVAAIGPCGGTSCSSGTCQLSGSHQGSDPTKAGCNL